MFESASAVMRKEGLVARPDERNRRPTKQELWRISREYYRKKTHEDFQAHDALSFLNLIGGRSQQFHGRKHGVKPTHLTKKQK